MSNFSPEDITKTAHLARLSFSVDEIAKIEKKLTDIIHFAEHVSEIRTDDVAPLIHPLEIHQRVRADAVTETNQRNDFQKIAPHTEAGLYLVPQVIE